MWAFNYHKNLTIPHSLTWNLPSLFSQDFIDSKLDKCQKGEFRPRMLKKQVFFIDDLNVPALEVFGAQAPIELIWQRMDFQGRELNFTPL
jgi:hypothetical protein